MQPDYPAAHSMHTIWFAVDADGHVAAFDTGAIGHAPTREGEGHNLLSELTRLLAPPPADPEAYVTFAESCSSAGMYPYGYGVQGGPRAVSFDVWLVPYGCRAVPAAPLHIDQLPPQLRQQCQRFRFDGLHFHESPCVQPMELYPCQYRYKAERVAYLCADLKTVRPIAGREAAFAAFVAEFRRTAPEQAAALVFEGPTSSEG